MSSKAEAQVGWGGKSNSKSAAKTAHMKSAVAAAAAPHDRNPADCCEWEIYNII